MFKENKNKILAIFFACALIVAGFVDWFLFMNNPKASEESFSTIAETWVREKASTYVFDGFDLKFEKEEAREGGARDFHFTFTSRGIGYGNRTGLLIGQALTSHRIVVTVKEDVIVQVITDLKYNEITGAYSE